MEIRDQFQHGIRVSAISRETGRDRKTIHEIVTAAAPRADHGPARAPQPRFLDPYTEYIRQRTQDGCFERGGV